MLTIVLHFLCTVLTTSVSNSKSCWVNSDCSSIDRPGAWCSCPRCYLSWYRNV